VSLLDDHAVVLITGISASGKSTVAQLLAERFARGVHVHGDAFRRMVVSGRADMTAEPTEEAWRQLRLRYALGAATTDRYFAAGFSVVVQDVVLGPELERYVDAIASRPLHVVVLCPHVDVVEQREAGRAKRAYGSGMFGMAALDVSLRQDTPRIGLWLDSSDMTAAQTVGAVVSRAAEALV
jgi:chloramphenicol 3-O-phosphotransferase